MKSRNALFTFWLAYAQLIIVISSFRLQMSDGSHRLSLKNYDKEYHSAIDQRKQHPAKRYINSQHVSPPFERRLGTRSLQADNIDMSIKELERILDECQKTPIKGACKDVYIPRTHFVDFDLPLERDATKRVLANNAIDAKGAVNEARNQLQPKRLAAESNPDVAENNLVSRPIFVDQNLIADIIRDPSIEDIVFIRKDVQSSDLEMNDVNKCENAAKQMHILKKLRAIHEDIRHKNRQLANQYSHGPARAKPVLNPETQDQGFSLHPNGIENSKPETGDDTGDVFIIAGNDERLTDSSEIVSTYGPTQESSDLTYSETPNDSTTHSSVGPKFLDGSASSKMPNPNSSINLVTEIPSTESDTPSDSTITQIPSNENLLPDESKPSNPESKFGPTIEITSTESETPNESTTVQSPSDRKSLKDRASTEIPNSELTTGSPPNITPSESETFSDSMTAPGRSDGKSPQKDGTSETPNLRTTTSPTTDVTSPESKTQNEFTTTLNPSDVKFLPNGATSETPNQESTTGPATDITSYETESPSESTISQNPADEKSPRDSTTRKRSNPEVTTGPVLDLTSPESEAQNDFLTTQSPSNDKPLPESAHSETLIPESSTSPVTDVTSPESKTPSYSKATQSPSDDKSLRDRVNNEPLSSVPTIPTINQATDETLPESETPSYSTTTQSPSNHKSLSDGATNETQNPELTTSPVTDVTSPESETPNDFTKTLNPSDDESSRNGVTSETPNPEYTTGSDTDITSFKSETPNEPTTTLSPSDSKSIPGDATSQTSKLGSTTVPPTDITSPKSENPNESTTTLRPSKYKSLPGDATSGTPNPELTTKPVTDVTSLESETPNNFTASLSPSDDESSRNGVTSETPSPEFTTGSVTDVPSLKSETPNEPTTASSPPDDKYLPGDATSETPNPELTTSPATDVTSLESETPNDFITTLNPSDDKSSRNGATSETPSPEFPTGPVTDVTSLKSETPNKPTTASRPPDDKYLPDDATSETPNPELTTSPPTDVTSLESETPNDFTTTLNPSDDESSRNGATNETTNPEFTTGSVTDVTSFKSETPKEPTTASSPPDDKYLPGDATSQTPNLGSTIVPPTDITSPKFENLNESTTTLSPSKYKSLPGDATSGTPNPELTTSPATDVTSLESETPNDFTPSLSPSDDESSRNGATSETPSPEFTTGSATDVPSLKSETPNEPTTASSPPDDKYHPDDATSGTPNPELTTSPATDVTSLESETPNDFTTTLSPYDEESSRNGATSDTPSPEFTTGSVTDVTPLKSETPNEPTTASSPPDDKYLPDDATSETPNSELTTSPATDVTSLESETPNDSTTAQSPTDDKFLWDRANSKTPNPASTTGPATDITSPESEPPNNFITHSPSDDKSFWDRVTSETPNPELTTSLATDTSSPKSDIPNESTTTLSTSDLKSLPGGENSETQMPESTTGSATDVTSTTSKTPNDLTTAQTPSDKKSLPGGTFRETAKPESTIGHVTPPVSDTFSDSSITLSSPGEQTGGTPKPESKNDLAPGRPTSVSETLADDTTQTPSTEKFLSDGTTGETKDFMPDAAKTTTDSGLGTPSIDFQNTLKNNNLVSTTPSDNMEGSTVSPKIYDLKGLKDGKGTTPFSTELPDFETISQMPLIYITLLPPKKLSGGGQPYYEKITISESTKLDFEQEIDNFVLDNPETESEMTQEVTPSSGTKTNPQLIVSPIRSNHTGTESNPVVTPISSVSEMKPKDPSVSSSNLFNLNAQPNENQSTDTDPQHPKVEPLPSSNVSKLNPSTIQGDNPSRESAGKPTPSGVKDSSKPVANSDKESMKFPKLPKIDLNAINKHTPLHDLIVYMNHQNKSPSSALKDKIDQAFDHAEVNLPMDLGPANSASQFATSESPQKMKGNTKTNQNELKNKIEQAVPNSVVADGLVNTFFVILLSNNATKLNLENWSEGMAPIEVDNLCIPLYENKKINNFMSITRLLKGVVYFKNSRSKVPIRIKQSGGRKCSSLGNYNVLKDGVISSSPVKRMAGSGAQSVGKPEGKNGPVLLRETGSNITDSKLIKNLNDSSLRQVFKPENRTPYVPFQESTGDVASYSSINKKAVDPSASKRKKTGEQNDPVLFRDSKSNQDFMPRTARDSEIRPFKKPEIPFKEIRDYIVSDLHMNKKSDIWEGQNVKKLGSKNGTASSQGNRINTTTNLNINNILDSPGNREGRKSEGKEDSKPLPENDRDHYTKISKDSIGSGIQGVKRQDIPISFRDNKVNVIIPIANKSNKSDNSRSQAMKKPQGKNGASSVDKNGKNIVSKPSVSEGSVVSTIKDVKELDSKKSSVLFPKNEGNTLVHNSSRDGQSANNHNLAVKKPDGNNSIVSFLKNGNDFVPILKVMQEPVDLQMQDVRKSEGKSDFIPSHNDGKNTTPNSNSSNMLDDSPSPPWKQLQTKNDNALLRENKKNMSSDLKMSKESDGSIHAIDKLASKSGPVLYRKNGNSFVRDSSISRSSDNIKILIVNKPQGKNDTVSSRENGKTLISNPKMVQEPVSSESQDFKKQKRKSGPVLFHADENHMAGDFNRSKKSENSEFETVKIPQGNNDIISFLKNVNKVFSQSQISQASAGPRTQDASKLKSKSSPDSTQETGSSRIVPDPRTSKKSDSSKGQSAKKAKQKNGPVPYRENGNNTVLVSSSIDALSSSERKAMLEHFFKMKSRINAELDSFIQRPVRLYSNPSFVNKIER